MKIDFRNLQLEHFKNQKEKAVFYSYRTKITGANAQGKTTLKDAPVWALYGTDATGTKLDPQPTTYSAPFVNASLTVVIDDVENVIQRQVHEGKTKIYVDSVPMAIKEYESWLASKIDKDVFLTLYNPEYFFTLHWEKQRSLLLSFVLPPASKEVLAKLPETQADKLKPLFKKHNVVQLEKMHRDNKVKKEREFIAAQSRVKTLKEQSSKIGSVVPVESLQIEISQKQKELEETKNLYADAEVNNSTMHNLQNKIENLTQQIEAGKVRHTKAKNRHIEEECFTCGQALTEQARGKAEEAKAQAVQSVAEEVNPLIRERKELREKLATMNYVTIPLDHQEKNALLLGEINNAQNELRKNEEVARLDQDIQSSMELESSVRESLNESVFILDALKEFNSKEAELQAAKVSSLFTNLSIKLFDTLKGSGELKATFAIEMNGKEYKKLSLSEKIKAGLELRNVISSQSEIEAPVFVDNAESITDIPVPDTGQLITATVVKDTELTVQNEGETA